MIRIHTSILVEGNTASGNAVYYIKGACAAADQSELPTEGIATGSEMLIVDDKSTVYFDESSETWA